MMKTPVVVLQELMVKMGQTPEYECINQTGPQHHAIFEYQCEAHGVTAKASGRSKKAAKQEVARAVLLQLSRRGMPVPAPFGYVPGEPQMEASTSVDTSNYVTLLRDFAQKYRLAPVEYDLVGDTGPPHLRQFTMRVRIGLNDRKATAATKKAARQLAAEEMYKFLRENLKRIIESDGSDEEEAMVPTRDKFEPRRKETSCQVRRRRPDLSRLVSEYHLGLTANLSEKRRVAAMAALERGRSLSPTSALAGVADAMGLILENTVLDKLKLVSLSNTTPELTFAGRTATIAASDALRYVTQALMDVVPPEAVKSPTSTEEAKALTPPRSTNSPEEGQAEAAGPSCVRGAVQLDEYDN